MPTAEDSLSVFLTQNADQILKLALKEGFTFSVKEIPECVTVQCTSPSGYTRFILFEDHRAGHFHGGKPHVCNSWHKNEGVPVSFTVGKDLADTKRLQSVLRASAVMCLTQSKGYDGLKESVFS